MYSMVKMEKIGNESFGCQFDKAHVRGTRRDTLISRASNSSNTWHLSRSRTTAAAASQTQYIGEGVYNKITDGLSSGEFGTCAGVTLIRRSEWNETFLKVKIVKARGGPSREENAYWNHLSRSINIRGPAAVCGQRF